MSVLLCLNMLRVEGEHGKNNLIKNKEKHLPADPDAGELDPTCHS